MAAGRQLRDLVTGVGILFDKLQLLNGDSTANTPTNALSSNTTTMRILLPSG